MPVSVLPPPLVLVVDDDERARELAEEAFTDQHCAVIAVGNPDDAVWELRSSPGIDLLFTDVKLRAEDDDTSGMRLGDYVKTTRPDVPVAVYSSVFLEGELDQVLNESAESRFDVVLARGGPLWGEGGVLNDCARRAREYRDKRFSEASERSTGAGSRVHMKVMREFVVGAASGSPSGELLKNSGYTLRLLDVRHGELRGPIAIWVLEHGDQVSAELYQHPSVHAVGRSVGECLDRLAVALHEELDEVAPDREARSIGLGSIPWLMLQHADDWEQVASEIESRD